MPLAGPVLWELIPGEPGNRRPRRSAIAIKRKGKLKKVNTLFRNFFEMGVDGFPCLSEGNRQYSPLLYK